jgi:glycosyltransferase involved in cell wall biosynthesis
MKYKVALLSTLYPSKEKPYSGTFIFEHVRWLLSQDWIESVYVINPRSIKAYFKAIIMLLKLKSINAIDAQFAIPVGLFAIFRPSVPTILMTHRWEVVDYDNYIYNIFLRASFSRADQIIAGSNYIGKRILKIQPNSKTKLNILNNGVDIKLIQSYRNKKSNLKKTLNSKDSEDSLEIVTVSQLIERKGVHIVIKGLAKLKKSINFNYYIIGSGPDRKILNKLIHKFNLSDSVHLVGPLVGEDLFSFINSTDIFILMASSEGFSFAVIEAKVAGNVIVLADYKGSEEAIIPNSEGFIIKRKPIAVKKIIEKLSNESETVQKIKKFNFTNALKHDLSERGKTLKKIYSKATLKR